MIHRALVDAVAWKYITDNPASNIKPPKRPRTRRKVWKPDQIQVFLMSVQHDRNNAGLVPSNRCSRCVEGRFARIGNLTSRGGFALRDSIRPVGVHLAVAVALDPSFCEQLPVEPQELGFVEPSKAFAADPGDHVRVWPTLWHRSMVRWARTTRRRIGRRCGDGVFAVTSRTVSFGALLDKSGEVCREAGGGRSIESCDVVSTAGDIGTQVIGEVIDLVHHAAEGAEVVEAVEVVPAPCLRDVA